MKKNLLDMIPTKNKKYKWTIIDNQIVQIHIDRNAIFDKFVRIFINTPKVTKIDLDRYGSKVWLEIDGKKNIYQIGKNLKNNFKDEIEPLYERLAEYMVILKNNNFISLKS